MFHDTARCFGGSANQDSRSGAGSVNQEPRVGALDSVFKEYLAMSGIDRIYPIMSVSLTFLSIPPVWLISTAGRRIKSPQNEDALCRRLSSLFIVGGFFGGGSSNLSVLQLNK